MITTVLDKSREQETKILENLSAERKLLYKEIDTCNAEIVRCAQIAHTSGLAALHERLKRLEQRYSAVVSDMQVWERERIDPDSVRTALQDFTPIWSVQGGAPV